MKFLVLLLAGLGLIGLVFRSYFGAPLTGADFAFTLIGEQRSLDPALATTVQEGRIIRGLFEGLVILDSKTLAPRPGVAESWEVSADGKRWVFRLRPCLWSDGTRVTAHDFAYAWRRILEPASLSSYDYMLFGLQNAERFRKGDLKDFDSVGVRAENDSTLRVDLSAPIPYFLDLAAFETLLPVNRACIERHGIRWTRPGNLVGNGAYILTFHQLNYKLRLEKNPLYRDTSRARFKIVDAYTCEGLNTAFNMYETGDASFIDDFPNLIAEEILKRPDARVNPYLGTYFYRFNVLKKPFDDPRVRRAFDMAVHKEEITRYVLKGGELPARSLVPPGIPGYTPYEGAVFNPDSARRLMAAAGYPGGEGLEPLELIYNTSENHKKIAEAVAFMLRKELGVEVRPANLEWKMLLSRVDEGDYVFARGNWIGDYTDPNTFLDMFVTGGGNNRTGWSDRRYDSLVAAAARIRDPGTRMDALRSAEKILIEEGSILPIYYYVTKILIKPDIQGFTPNIRAYFHIADLYRL